MFVLLCMKKPLWGSAADQWLEMRIREFVISKRILGFMSLCLLVGVWSVVSLCFILICLSCLMRFECAEDVFSWMGFIYLFYFVFSTEAISLTGLVMRRSQCCLCFFHLAYFMFLNSRIFLIVLYFQFQFVYFSLSCWFFYAITYRILNVLFSIIWKMMPCALGLINLDLSYLFFFFIVDWYFPPKERC